MEEFKTYKLEELTIGKGEYGIGASSCTYNDDFPQYIRITDISDDGRYCPAPAVSINPFEYPNYEEYFLKEILLSSIYISKESPIFSFRLFLISFGITILPSSSIFLFIPVLIKNTSYLLW